jgi:hypothetical protein
MALDAGPLAHRLFPETPLRVISFLSSFWSSSSMVSDSIKITRTIGLPIRLLFLPPAF